MHKMTSTTPYRLRIEVQAAYNNLWYSAEYDTFLIDSEVDGYAIHVTGYHGDAGDALQYSSDVHEHHNGMKFSTRDVDNDLDPYVSWATIYKAGNWYNDCSFFVLTGSKGVGCWFNFISDLGFPDCGLNASRMMIKKF